MNKFIFDPNITDAAGDASCPNCGGSKPTCCSCPEPTLSDLAQCLVDQWLVDRRLLDQALITMQDRQELTKRITLLLGEFLGPLSPSDAEQLAELRKAMLLIEQSDPEMKPRAITQIRRGSVVTETMLFCADKPCGEHYQMGCEG